MRQSEWHKLDTTEVITIPEIEVRLVYLFVYVWTYVRHFCTSISTRITLEIELFTVLNSFAGAVKT